MTKPWIAATLGLTTLLAHTASAQTHPDLRQILQRVSDTYRAASQYELFAAATTHDDDTNDTARMHFAFKGPNRYRMEGALPGGMALDAAEFSQAVLVHDGSNLWFYLPKTNQYGSFSASQLTPDAGGDLGDLAPGFLDQMMLGRYRDAAAFPVTSFLREEAVEFGGSKVACYVVTVSRSRNSTVYTWWIDKQTNYILREDNPGSSTVFTAIKINEPLADTLFRFDPPAGARKVDIGK